MSYALIDKEKTVNSSRNEIKNHVNPDWFNEYDLFIINYVFVSQWFM